MVRISTKYDNTIVNDKEVGKVFMIRGDEAYARTTDTIFNIITDNTSSTSSKGYMVGFCYDVLRDTGSSTLVLYDNDIVLQEYEWDSDDGMQYVGTTNDHTVIDPSTCLYLPYNEEHKLWMRYKGNNSCLYSKSKPVTVYAELPSEFQTEVAFSNINMVMNNISFDLTLAIDGDETSDTYNKGIEIYLDDDLIDTVTTPSDDNVVSKTLTGVSTGHHMITATVVGDEDIYTSTNTYEFDIGYDITIVSYPKPFINNTDGDIVVRVLCNGEPVDGRIVEFSTGSALTDSDGYATITLNSFISSGEYVAICDGYMSDPVYIELYSPTISIDIDYDVVDAGRWGDDLKTRLVTFSIDEKVGNIPFTYEIITPSRHITRSVSTDDAGQRIMTETCTQEGRITINAWIDGLKSTTFVTKTTYDSIIQYDGNKMNDLDKLQFTGVFLSSKADGYYVAYKNSNDTLRMRIPKTDSDFRMDFDLKMINCSKFTMRIHNEPDGDASKLILVDTTDSDRKSGKFSIERVGDTISLMSGGKTWYETYDTTSSRFDFYFPRFTGAGNMMKINSFNYYKI